MSFTLYFTRSTGDIKAISPVAIQEFDITDSIQIDDDLAIKFINCEYQMHQWFTVWNGTEFKLVQNTLDLLSSDHGTIIQIGEDSGLFTAGPFPGLTIDVFKKTNIVTVSIPFRFVGKKLSNITQKKTTFLITAKSDPVNVIDEIEVDINELMERGALSYSVKTVDADFHTKKVFPQYRLVRHETEWKKTVNSGYKVNKLSLFKKGNDGHFSATLTDSELVLRLEKGVPFYPNASGVIIVTAPNDATIMIEPLKYDFNELLNEGEVRIPYKCVEKNVGLAGFPITENMVFRDERTIQNQ